MKIFIIPSWYPSESNPIYGTFNHEQARLMASARPEWSVGVSMWGQGDERFLLRALDPNSWRKALRSYEEDETQVNANFTEYFSPAFSWTRKFRQGNINGIIRANESNLRRFIGKYGSPDILSVQASYPGAIVARSLSEKYQIPFIVTARMSPFPFSEFLARKGMLKPLLEEPLKKALMLLATSDSLKKRLVSFGFSKVEILNNPIDLDFFQPITNNAAIAKMQILTVGRMEEQKGIDILLEAFKQLKGAELVVAGDGSLLEYYQGMAKKFEVSGRVKWLGRCSREEVRSAMQNCSFYVLSSRHETFGNVLLEAMACGKPVVATKCGGPQEIVTKEIGYLSEINADDLAHKMNAMMENLDSFNVGAIRKHVVTNYSPEVWLERLERIVTSVEQA